MKSLLFLVFIACSTTLFGQWNHIPSGNNYSLDFVKIHEATGTCIAGGTNFLKSSDAGLTWTTVSSPIYLNIYSVVSAVIVSNSTFVLVENSNGYYRMWRTTNGGSTWTSYTQSNGIIRDMVSNGSIILAVGDGNLIKKSVDNGATWTTVSSPIYTNFKTVEWDAGSNNWVLGGEIRRMISANSNPTSFTYTTLPYTISDLSFNNGHLVETRTFTNNTQSVVLYDGAGTAVSETFSNSIQVRDASYVSSNKIVSNNYYNFYEIHPDQTNMFQSVDTLVSNSLLNGVEIHSMDFCSTYGLAVGASGGIARYDMSAASNLLLPATFNFNTTNPCAGTPVIATPEYPGGDSFQWYLDGVPVSVNDTLFFNQPANGVNHNVTLDLTYNGNTTTYTKPIVSTPPPTFPTFGVNVDTTLCYLDQVKIYFTGVTATPAQNFKVRLLRNGVVVSDTMNFNYGINYIPGPVLSEDDTIQLQLFKTIACGTFYETVDYHFHVGPNLNTFQLVSADSGICQVNSQLHFSLANTVPGASYSFNFVTFQNSVYHSNFAGFTGVGSDTLDFSYNASNFFDLYAYNNANIYEYPNSPEYISLNASYNGCSIADVHIFDLDVLYTDAKFSIRNSSYFPGDTVKFTRVLTCDNFAWDISPTVPVMENLTDSIPLFVPDLPGVYTIKLTVESRLGCTDTLSQRIIVADSIPNPNDQVCNYTKLPAMALIGSKISPKGNYYDFGYFCKDCCPTRNGFALRKLDKDGNLLWDKNNISNYGKSLICAMDIDANENVYAIIYVENNSFQFESINYSGEIDGTTFLVKWDSLGNMVQSKKLWKVVFSDLVVLDNQILICYFGGIYAYDLDFNLINTFPHTGSVNYGVLYNANSISINDWGWSPNKIKLEKLANGNVAMVSSTYNSTTTFGPFTLTRSFPCIGTTCSQHVYAAILDPDSGFINAAKVFEFDTENGLPVMDVCSDNESNIYILTQNNFSTIKTAYFDSIIPFNTRFNKSYLAKLNSNLEPVWLKETSVTNGTLNCAKASEELVLSGIVYSDFYIGSGNEFYRMNGKNEPLMEYYLITDDLGLELYEPFLAKLDLNGNPLSGRMIGKEGFGDHTGELTTRTLNTVSPCGDIYLTHQDRGVDTYNIPPYTYNPSINQLEFNGQIYSVDSTLVFKFSSTTACQDECTFFQFNGNDIQGSCNADTVDIPVNFVYGIDSVAYDLVANGSIIEFGYMHFNGFNLELLLPNTSSEYSVVLHPANQSSDTVHLSGFIQPITPILQSNYSVPCGEELVLSVSNTVFNSSNWIHSQGMIDPAFTSTYTNSDFIIGDTTTYSVSTIDSNGCSASASFNILYCYDLGIDENGQTKFIVFPNPVSDMIHIQSSGENYSGVALDLLDTKGIKISTHQMTGVSSDISTQKLSNGYYFLRINSGNEQVELIPFIKE